MDFKKEDVLKFIYEHIKISISGKLIKLKYINPIYKNYFESLFLGKSFVNSDYEYHFI